MEKIVEVELKFEVLNQAKVNAFIKRLDPKGVKKVKDIYLDTKTGDLFKKGIFIRVRNNKTLDFKFNLKEMQKDAITEKLDHSHCNEYNFNLPLTPDSLDQLNEVSELLGMKMISKADLEVFKFSNHLMESVTIERQRSTYKKEDFEIVIDEVGDLGTFLEIEYQATYDNDIEWAKADMRLLVKDLELKPINTGYNELYWRKHNFDLYLQGKYLLDEDFQKYRSKSS